MPITRSTDAVYTLLNATVMEDGRLNCTFGVVIDDITNFSVTLMVPQTETAAILDATITDGSSIRTNLTTKICEHFIATGEIVGTLTA
jgi:hypothetical protein